MGSSERGMCRGVPLEVFAIHGLGRGRLVKLVLRSCNNIKELAGEPLILGAMFPQIIEDVLLLDANLQFCILNPNEDETAVVLPHRAEHFK